MLFLLGLPSSYFLLFYHSGWCGKQEGLRHEGTGNGDIEMWVDIFIYHRDVRKNDWVWKSLFLILIEMGNGLGSFKREHIYADCRV